MPETSSNATPGFARSYSIPVDPAHGFRRVSLELSVPSLPSRAAGVGFAEHVSGSDTVIACKRGGLVFSEDLGQSWEYVDVPEADADLRTAFTTWEGRHLLQADGPSTLGVPRGDPREDAPIFVFDDDWRLVDRLTPGRSRWHGTRSIDEAGGVIVYGEYPANSGRFKPDFNLDAPTPEQAALVHDSHLLRSTDGGRSWSVVLTVDWRTIRHFHTVASDPHRPGRWWASSGDAPSECRVWESVDDGATWHEISTPEPDVQLHPRWQENSQTVFRYTDLAVREHDVIWGADDLLGAAKWADDPDVPVHRRAGARLFRSPKDAPWAPESIGYVGHPVRSLVDVGHGYVVITEAKGFIGYCPQVLFLSKREPFLLTPLMTIDNHAARATGFTFSRGSRAAKDGVFFTHRGQSDAFSGGVRLLRWRIDFD